MKEIFKKIGINLGLTICVIILYVFLFQDFFQADSDNVPLYVIAATILTIYFYGKRKL